ncbi:site-specific integrase [Erythrobacter neustonensis]|uniref:Integrase n=1 Tax=Erythrobacter neustonensis TaxID=1112 RepID=A0A192D8E8_9SPHN|nr:site-specific integrase [Erythrobacter neustonensis]ANK14385.1 integrase [Erythrobacter neustonensis]
MCGIQNVTRKQGTYYFRRLIRLGPDKPFRLRFSLKTTSRKRAALLAPAMTLICERLAMNMTAKIATDALTAAQRAEIFRRQMLVERDRLEVMHAQLHIHPPEDHEDIEKALSLRLGASELAAVGGATKGRVEDFLVARIDPDAEEEPIVVMAWSDLAASIAQEGAEEAAVARLAEIGVAQSALREAMARKVVNQARIEAIREFRATLANPGAAYASVPVAGYEQLAQPTLYSATTNTPQAPAAPVVAGPWATMTPTEAVEKFFEHNPRTGGSDGKSRRKGGRPWTDKTREQFRLPALLLEQIMFETPLARVTHDHLVQLNNCFEALHGPSFRKSPKQREMTIWEVVEETEKRVRRGEEAIAKAAKRKGTEDAVKMPAGALTRDQLGLGLSTTNRHWGFLRQLTTWFAKHHPLSPLDYSSFIENDDRNARDQRDTYTEEQGRMLFSLPPWTGSKSLARRMQPGDLHVHSAWYFVPLIGWYTGMRREEICGLMLDDIEVVDGHWQFDVRPTEIRRLKTITSARKLPLASELVRLGLPDYVTALREAGETMLFPELVAESGKGTMGDAYYKTIWTKIARALPFLKSGQATQSFRHTVINAMKGAEVMPELRADFAGHKLSSETEGRYSKAHMELLRKAAAAIPIVTEHLDPFPAALLPARLRAPRRARSLAAGKHDR